MTMETARQGLKFYRFPNLARFPEVVHGIFTRRGGVSAGPFASLNLSFAVGDEPELVQENRRRIIQALGLSALAGADQVHGLKESVLHAGNPAPAYEIPEVDILITQTPGLGLLIKQADCQAVMLYDPEHGVVANIHCGWRGQVAGILEKTVVRLRKNFKTQPHRLIAGIGPGLGPCCAEFRHFRQEFPRQFWQYQVRPDYFDLWQLSRDQLCAAGLRPDHINLAGVCTKCNPEFYSYRRDGLTGRQGAVIALRLQR
ncbi:MAG: polyphenol oxidase family protein [Deltaproteobacteria bacterium]|nr:polyphenol oxidase family protein [Deltaproteobacteria bacterium]